MRDAGGVIDQRIKQLQEASATRDPASGHPPEIYEGTGIKPLNTFSKQMQLNEATASAKSPARHLLKTLQGMRDKEGAVRSAIDQIQAATPTEPAAANSTKTLQGMGGREGKVAEQVKDLSEPRRLPDRPRTGENERAARLSR